MIPNVVKFEVVSTLVYQQTNGTLNFLDTAENSPDTWEQKLIMSEIDKNVIWSTGYFKLIVIKNNAIGQTPVLYFYENYIDEHSTPTHKMELDFRVKDICVAKHLFYLISENGQVHQGEYENYSLVQITKDQDFVKQQEIQQSEAQNEDQNDQQ